MKWPLSVAVIDIRGPAKALCSFLMSCFQSDSMRAVANILLNCVLGRGKKKNVARHLAVTKRPKKWQLIPHPFFHGVSPRSNTPHPKTLKAALMYYLTTPWSADTECQWLQSIWYHGPECLFKWWFNWPNGGDTKDKFFKSRSMSRRRPRFTSAHVKQRRRELDRGRPVFA